GAPVPVVPNPLTPPSSPVLGNPAWAVLGQASTLTSKISTGRTPALPDPAGTRTHDVGSRVAVLETFDPPVGERQLWGDPSFVDVFDPMGLVGVAVALVDASHGGAVDPPPAPGQPGVTGSG